MEQINERPLNWSTTNLTTFYGTLNLLSNGKKQFISLQKRKDLDIQHTNKHDILSMFIQIFFCFFTPQKLEMKNRKQIYWLSNISRKIVFSIYIKSMYIDWKHSSLHDIWKTCSLNYFNVSVSGFFSLNCFIKEWMKS